ncbi:MAG: hypothetical protein ABIH41_07040 [Nanoarchaeota archaeon]
MAMKPQEEQVFNEICAKVLSIKNLALTTRTISQRDREIINAEIDQIGKKLNGVIRPLLNK